MAGDLQKIKKLAEILKGARKQEPVKAEVKVEAKAGERAKVEAKKEAPAMSKLAQKTAEAEELLKNIRASLKKSTEDTAKNLVAGKKKLSLKKKAEEVDSITDSHETTNRLDTAESDFSNKTEPIDEADNASAADLERLKKEQLSLAPETLLAEDTRSAYKKAITLAAAQINKNLLKGAEHNLKSALFEALVPMFIPNNTPESGMEKAETIATRKATIVIESAFEVGANKYIEQVLKRADEVSELGDDAIDQLTTEINLVCTIAPSGDMEEGIEDIADEAMGEEEPVEEELEEKLIEGSFRLPRTASAKGQNILARALPGYNTPDR